MMRLLAIALSAAFFALALAAGPVRSQEASMTAAGAAAEAGPSLLQRAGAFLVLQQRNVNHAINQQLVDIKRGDNPTAIWGGILIGFLYGVFHALGPGHGKMVIIGYFLGREAKPWRGVVMANWIALSHVIAAIFIVVIAHIILSRSLASPVDEVQGLRYFSYGAILLIGIGMLASALRRQGSAHAHGHGHSGGQAEHAHDLACGHHHGGGTEQGLLAIAAGFVPCSGAILILVFCLTNDIVLSGIIMTLAIAVGMGLTLSTMGVASILLRRQLSVRLPGNALTSRALSLAGPILISAIGALLLVGAFLTQGVR